MNAVTDISEQDAKRVFNISCIALIVTAMTFAIRAGILGELGEQYGLSGEELGWIASMAFLGFPFAMMFGGILYNAIGAKLIVWLAFIGHALGLILTIVADGFWGLMISTFLVGFANGLVEAGCNPIIAQLYPNNKTAMLNRFHVWFPGGIVIGSLVSAGMTKLGLGWEAQVATMLVPTAIYGFLMFGFTFPKLETEDDSTSGNLKALINPIYIFLAVCMTITAVSEFGPGQWINQILEASGATPMLILALITGIMALGRFYAGPLVHKLSPPGVLFASAILATLGLFLMTQLSGTAVYIAAVVFALGITYFWPTMIGCTTEYTPKTGALGMSLMGGAGMFAMSAWNPIIGGWVDSATSSAAAAGLEGTEASLAAGNEVLNSLIMFPLVLIVLFGAFYFVMRKKA
ncbi:MFS transporter [Paraglaciecola aquimarina]|uniref:MFS transporter n=1 Tax=Paraglaciecola algarum TaxID=3050085 RepID=A0ABS9D3M2_9ALTE|nr:MFS transporter [Paraglaciecola sp. G1-23]MCF2947481.1 MFS transporter [Paraglaciecola sp. G1-23]